MTDIPREFDDRYRKHRERLNVSSIAAEYEQFAENHLRSIRSVPGRPVSMACFEEALLSSIRGDSIGSPEKPVVGVYCNFVPDELIHAAGAVPARLCSGSPSAATVAEEYLPRDVCPVVRSCFGHIAVGAGLAKRAAVVVVPASCDGKRKLPGFLRDYLDVWVVDIPGRRDYATDMQVWLRETKLVRSRLEALTGRRISYDDLRESIILYHRRTEAFRDLVDLRMRYPHILSGRDFMLVTNASFAFDVRSWTDAVRALLGELKRQAQEKPASPAGFLPLVLTGSPIIWPNFKMLSIIEEAGAAIVADTLCSGTQRLFDPVQVDEWTDEGMMRALALRYFSASLCPCFSDSADSIDRVLELVQDYSARGVVSHNLRLCQLIDMETSRLRTVLRDRGIPFLGIHTDLSQEDREQVKTRVEAFLEMIGGVSEPYGG